ncbi:uncharacterized protein LOC132615112 [Lycium barbarum]|uniref:uncharacterized protein LOC132615112 n=1 Tax=Lycium barbarum TaxID=112863 RepID=UPI00293E2029|nr:uncharacterized protein LOC132615112 [Lycium barbarum]
MYRKLRGTYPKVTWKKIICSNQGRPRWIFILYLALQGKLYTNDKLIKWGKQYSPTCPLCVAAGESIQHLFFLCPISAGIWHQVLQWKGIIKPVQGWMDEQAWAKQHGTGNSAKAELYRMTPAGCVYYTWQERNQRLFQSKQRTEGSILRQLIQDIHCRGARLPRLAKQLDVLNFYP